MALFIFIAVTIVWVAVSTALFAGGLLITGEQVDQEALIKCLGINMVACGVSTLYPIMFGLVWIVALMQVFDKNLVESLLVSVVCWVVMFAVGSGLGMMAV